MSTEKKARSLRALFAQMDREFAPVPDHDEQRGPLYHYTDGAGLLGVIEKREIWATQVRHLNDREELIAGERIVDQEISTLQSASAGVQLAFFRYLASAHGPGRVSELLDIYVASLSAVPDLLSQWRGYGANGAGYSIGLSSFPRPARNAKKPALSVSLMECQYGAEAFRATVRDVLATIGRQSEEYVQNYGGNFDPNKILSESVAIALRRIAVLVPRLKNGAFQEECEWRLVALPWPNREAEVVRFRNGPVGIKAYIPVPLTPRGKGKFIDLESLWVGPTVDPTAGPITARRLLANHRYDPDRVKVSRVPYRG